MTKKKLLLRRGTFANLPDLDEGEPGWVTDKKILVIGDSSGSEGTFINSGSVVHPEEYGAIGDGSTDDTAAIQAALDSLTGGGVLELLPATTYRFTNLTITIDNTILRGKGWGSVLETTAARTADTYPIIWVKASRCQLKDFKITWSTMPAALQAGTSIEENDVIAVGHNFDVDPTIVTDCVVDNVYVYGAKQHGISVGYSTGCSVRNCKVEEIYGTGIWIFDAEDLKIHNNYVYRTSDAGIDLSAGTGRYADNVNISNNIINSTSIAVGSHGGRNVVIAGNVIDNTLGGAIFCQESVVYGINKPYITNVTGNTIQRPFQFYGAGAFFADDRYTIAAGYYPIIEVLSDSEVNISNNIINDDSGLTYYEGITACGTKVVVMGNVVTMDGAVGLRISKRDVAASDYGDIDYCSVRGNVFVMTAGDAANNYIMVLAGVGGGVISGNHFSGGTAAIIAFLNATWVKNIHISGNRVDNYTTPYQDGGDNLEIVFMNNHGLLDYTPDSDTTTNLADVTHAINTAAKTLGKCVYNTTTNRFVYANGTAAADVWVYMAGVTAHSPV